MEIAQIISIVCLSIGGGLFGLCVVFWVLRHVRPRPAGPAPAIRPAGGGAPAQAGTDGHRAPRARCRDPPIPEEQPRQGRRRLARRSRPPKPSSGDSLTTSPTAARGIPLSPGGGARTNAAVLRRRWRPRPRTAVSPCCWPMSPPRRRNGPRIPSGRSSAGTGGLGPGERPRSRSRRPGRDSPWPVCPRRTASWRRTPSRSRRTACKSRSPSSRRWPRASSRRRGEQSEPLSSTLKELAQQVSAIREYAACQQDRVEKLQDGYDWGIIRTFCLRVIRCIDNIENRIDNPPKDCADLIYLEEVRDELLFALESSGSRAVPARDQQRVPRTGETRGSNQGKATCQEARTGRQDRPGPPAGLSIYDG